MLATDIQIRGNVSSKTWSLCIGAGVSHGLIPSWLELTRRLVNRCFGVSVSPDQFKRTLFESGWSLDAWIQGCFNRFISNPGATPEAFTELIEETLYNDILAKATKHNLEAQLRTALNEPRRMKRQDVEALIAFFNIEYPTSTAVKLAKSLIKAENAGKAPQAIISFNADALLYLLLELYSWEQRGTGSWPAKKFRRVVRAFPTDFSEIPIFHLHGCLVPKPEDGITRTRVFHRDSRTNLIFLESEYSKGASNVFSWAQSTFLFYAQYSRMLFVGLSMSDPNVRRWLHWVEAARKSNVGKKPLSLTHYWLTQNPSDAVFATAVIGALGHLGVRTLTLIDWAEIDVAMNNLLALP